MSHVARTGKPLFISSHQERNELFPSLSGRGDDGHALAVLPLTLEGRVIGLLGLSFGRDMEFSESRRRMKMTLARQAALALERARLYEAERAARERLSFIVEASELLSSSMAYERTPARLARLVVPRLSHWCAVDILGLGGGVARRLVA